MFHFDEHTRANANVCERVVVGVRLVRLRFATAAALGRPSPPHNHHHHQQQQRERPSFKLNIIIDKLSQGEVKQKANNNVMPMVMTVAATVIMTTMAAE